MPYKCSEICMHWSGANTNGEFFLLFSFPWGENDFHHEEKYELWIRKQSRAEERREAGVNRRLSPARLFWMKMNYFIKHGWNFFMTATGRWYVKLRYVVCVCSVGMLMLQTREELETEEREECNVSDSRTGTGSEWWYGEYFFLSSSVYFAT